MHGAIILSVAGIFSKVLGACFRIPLGNMIGADGMGYYQAVYPIYILLLTIATTGIPVAISRMVSERLVAGDRGGAQRVFRVTLVIMSILGAALFAVMFIGAEYITSNIKDMEGSVYAMKAIAPALLIVPVMATFRGYFQGSQNMKPTAVSQITEQLFRVTIGLIAAYALLSAGKNFAAAGATFGATAGSLAGLAAIFFIYKRYRSSVNFRGRREETRQAKNLRRESTGNIIATLFVIAAPITLGAAIMPVMNFIDVHIVTNRLANSGLDALQVRTLYGQLTGFAQPIVNLPDFLTQAVAVSMVPAVVRAYKARDREFLHLNVQLGLRFAMIVGLPCSVGLMLLSEPIMKLIYFRQPADAAGAAPSMTILAVGIVFLSTYETTSGALQGVGKQMIPVLNLVIGALVKIMLTYTLTSVKALNIKGAAIGTVAAFIVAMALNYRAVKIYTGTRFDISKTFLRPLLSVAVMGIVCKGVHLLMSQFVGSHIATFIAILLAAVVYFVMIFATKSIHINELRYLPKGDKLTRLYLRTRRKFKRRRTRL
ncbi:MAG: polysaccharide biosynthesis protein [Clostridiales Family XIII bacterium]|jgi:stage V sporulation protein B|nr:polysaccharide biosynthesis protein [Clostridiales Family XIII bacterium]